MDSLYGMGKSCFAGKYLALVERFRQRIPNEKVYQSDTLANELRLAIVGTPSSPQPAAIERGTEEKKLFLEELQSARTLMVVFNAGDLFNCDTRHVKFRDRIIEAVEHEWKLIVPDSVRIRDWQRLSDILPKPFFLVLDETSTGSDHAVDTVFYRNSKYRG